MSQEIAQTESTSPLPVPEQWEKMGAAAVHLISIPAPLWGPVIAGLVMKGRSKYVESHSWKALREHLILSACLLVWGIGSLIFTIFRLYGHWQNNWETLSWQEVAIRLLISWGIFMVLGIVTTVLSIGQAITAYGGAWPKNEIKKALKSS